jgi:hypothetical protein
MVQCDCLAAEYTVRRFERLLGRSVFFGGAGMGEVELVYKQWDCREDDDGWIVASPPSLDRDNDRNPATSIELGQFLKNPALMWGHNCRDPWAVIGRAKEVLASEDLRAWAGGEDWPPAKYRQGFILVRGDPDDLTSHVGPHHDVIDGRLHTVWRGVSAARCGVSVRTPRSSSPG